MSIICGSGWGEVVQAFPSTRSLNYSEIPGIGDTTIKGHAGKLILADFDGIQVLIFQGRRHLYEGVGWDPIRFPILLSYELNAKTVLLTNAAGGISSDFKVGDIMVLDDHINFMNGNPLQGPVVHPDMPRFPDQTKIYDPKLIDEILKIGTDQEITIHRGVYLALSGPAFETPAEIQAFAKLGADAVGMSTVPEAMVANALGMRVVALSCISNLAAGISKHTLSHKDVEEASKKALPHMKAFVLSFITSVEKSH
jgi:purine-nucleoside phosphorylase